MDIPMPNPFGTKDRQDNPAKTERSEPNKPKPFAIPSVPLEFMPPPCRHPHRLVSVTGKRGDVLYLAFSDGIDWLMISLGSPMPLPSDVTDDDVQEFEDKVQQSTILFKTET